MEQEEFNAALERARNDYQKCQEPGETTVSLHCVPFESVDATEFNAFEQAILAQIILESKVAEILRREGMSDVDIVASMYTLFEQGLAAVDFNNGKPKIVTPKGLLVHEGGKSGTNGKGTQ